MINRNQFFLQVKVGKFYIVSFLFPVSHDFREKNGFLLIEIFRKLFNPYFNGHLDQLRVAIYYLSGHLGNCSITNIIAKRLRLLATASCLPAYKTRS